MYTACGQRNGKSPPDLAPPSVARAIGHSWCLDNNMMIHALELCCTCYCVHTVLKYFHFYRLFTDGFCKILFQRKLFCWLESFWKTCIFKVSTIWLLSAEWDWVGLYLSNLVFLAISVKLICKSRLSSLSKHYMNRRNWFPIKDN